MRVALTLESRNVKTGPIPVSTTTADSCPPVCPLSSGGCYAKSGPLAIYWRKVTDGRAGMSWDEFCEAIEALPEGTLWRHNQAGDLPGEGNAIDNKALTDLAISNMGRRGFTYTHKPPLEGDNALSIAFANRNGFTINLSANSLAHADELAGLALGPVVVILPAEQMTNTQTPAGRKVVVCPAVTREGVSCASCGLCARVDRPSIIGFPAHGSSKRKASTIAEGSK